MPVRECCDLVGSRAIEHQGRFEKIRASSHRDAFDRRTVDRNPRLERTRGCTATLALRFSMPAAKESTDSAYHLRGDGNELVHNADYSLAAE